MIIADVMTEASCITLFSVVSGDFPENIWLTQSSASLAASFASSSANLGLPFCKAEMAIGTLYIIIVLYSIAHVLSAISWRGVLPGIKL